MRRITLQAAIVPLANTVSGKIVYIEKQVKDPGIFSYVFVLVSFVRKGPTCVWMLGRTHLIFSYVIIFAAILDIWLARV